MLHLQHNPPKMLIVADQWPDLKAKITSDANIDMYFMYIVLQNYKNSLIQDLILSFKTSHYHNEM